MSIYKCVDGLLSALHVSSPAAIRGGLWRPAPATDLTNLDFFQAPSILASRIVIGSTKDLNFTVENSGGGTLAGAASIAPSPFSILGSNTYSLGADATKIITVRFSPTALGTTTQTATFTGGDGGSASLQEALAPLRQAEVAKRRNRSAKHSAQPAVSERAFYSQFGQHDLQATETADPSQGGEAQYLIQVPTAGDYVVTATVNAPNDGANSLFINFDTLPTSPDMIWDIPVNNSLTNNVATWRGTGGDTKTWSLSASMHLLILRGREADVKVGQITVSNTAPTTQQVGQAFSSTGDIYERAFYSQFGQHDLPGD